MFQRDWSRGFPHTSWSSAPTGPGLYVIGRAEDVTAPIGEAPGAEGKMGGFPANLLPLYIGCSKSMRSGVRGKLYRHCKGQGNKSIDRAVEEGLALHFLYIAGQDSAGYEALYLHIQTGFHFPYNRRSELTRYLIDTSRAPDVMGFRIPDPFQPWETTRSGEDL